jgi:hypothetical protein
VLATRIVGLLTTVLCVLPPAYFALMALAFGLASRTPAASCSACCWASSRSDGPLRSGSARRARHVWQVLIALVPTVLTVAYLWIG